MSDAEGRTTSRSRSRSPLTFEKQEDNADAKNNRLAFNLKSFHYQSCIKISNVPIAWKNMDLKKYIIDFMKSEKIKVSNIFVLIKKFPKGENIPRTAEVKFQYAQTAEEVYEKLQNIVIAGNQLQITLVQRPPNNIEDTPPKELGKKYAAKNFQNNMLRPFQHESFRENFSTDHTYGLNRQFLYQLGIKTPMSTRIFVTNLPEEVDEDKLHEVFSLAGNVVDLHLIRVASEVSAAITYDHPVEAVQAVSMFNNQSFMGNNMAVRMTRKKNMLISLPPGLGSVGPGLGHDGRPLRYVRAHVEVEQIKYDIRNWLQNIDNTNQKFTNTKFDNTNVQPNSQSDLLKLLSSTANPFNMGDINSNQGVNQNIQSLLQGLVQQANAQNTLQSVLALMANAGNQQTNQTVPTPQPVNIVQPPMPSIPSNQQNSPNMLNQQNSQIMPNRMIPPNTFNQPTPPNMLNQQNSQNMLNQQNPQNMLNQQNPQNMLNQPTPQNMLNQVIPQNMLNQQNPQIMPNRMVTPNTFNQPTPPNMPNQPNPRNMVNQLIPQNMFNQHNPSNMFNQPPLNMRNQQIPPNMFTQYMSNKPNQQREYSSSLPTEAESFKGKSDEGYKKLHMGDMVVFKNLPPSVGIESLKSKMEEVGDIKFAEMTSEGKAIIRFAKESQAEKCINFFNRCKVDGQLIEVCYV